MNSDNFMWSSILTVYICRFFFLLLLLLLYLFCASEHGCIETDAFNLEFAVYAYTLNYQSFVLFSINYSDK